MYVNEFQIYLFYLSKKISDSLKIIYEYCY